MNIADIDMSFRMYQVWVDGAGNRFEIREVADDNGNPIFWDYQKNELITTWQFDKDDFLANHHLLIDYEE